MDDLPRGQRAHTPDTWSRAKDDFVAGLSAPQVGERYGLSESTLRKKARAEGWRRADQPEPEAPPAGPAAPDLDPDRKPIPAADLVRMARLRMEDAVSAGRVMEARSWARLHTEFRMLSDERGPPSADEQAVKDALDAQSVRDNYALVRAIRADLAKAAGVQPDLADEDAPDEDDDFHLHRPDSPDRHDVSDAAPAPKRPLNRAERRKRERLTRWKAKQEARGCPPDD